MRRTIQAFSNGASSSGNNMSADQRKAALPLDEAQKDRAATEASDDAAGREMRG